MATFQKKNTKKYKSKKNYYLRDPSISLKAKGLLSEMLSLPNNWDYSIAGFAKINKENKDAIRAAVQELEAEGYLVRHQVKDANGKFNKNEYIIYEAPRSVELFSETLASEKPSSENPTEINIYNAKNNNKKMLKDDEFRTAVITGIEELADESWCVDIKNDLFLGMMALYNPNRIVKDSRPARSESSVNATFQKLAQCSQDPQVMLEMLYTALESDWSDVRVPKSCTAVSLETEKEGA